MPGSESESSEGSPHRDSYSGAGVGDLEMEAGVELKKRCKWGGDVGEVRPVHIPRMLGTPILSAIMWTSQRRRN